MEHERVVIRNARALALSTCGLLAAMSVPPTLHGQPVSNLQPPSGSAAVFEPNFGQFTPSVRFVSRGNGYTLFLTDTDAVLALRGSAQAGSAAGAAATIRLSLENPARRDAIGVDRQPGIVNYLIGNDPALWRTQIPTFSRVEYKAVYPGIDLVYYGREGVHEYDFVVAPLSSCVSAAASHPQRPERGHIF